MLYLLLATTLTFGDVTVKVATLDGDNISGEITSLSADTLALKTDGVDRMFAVRNLLSVTPQHNGSKNVAPIGTFSGAIVELLDGSRLLGTKYSVANSKAKLKLTSGAEAEIPTRAIRSVRLKSHENRPELKLEWNEIVGSKIAGDTIIIRKEVKVPVGDKGAKTEYSLNSLDGVLRNVTDEVVEFDYAGDTLPVKRQKVEGFVYYHTAGRKFPTPICRVYEASGSQWLVRSLDLNKGVVKVESASGVRTLLDLKNIVKFDFTAGNTTYLSDLAPERIEWNPYLDFGTTSKALIELNKPRMDRGLLGEKLSLFVKDETGQRVRRDFDKGISVHSRTLLAYRLPADSKRFIAKTGISPSATGGGYVKLVISGDRETLLEAIVKADDESPLVIDKDVSGFKRLTILVDFGDESDFSDHLNLCNARITK